MFAGEEMTVLAQKKKNNPASGKKAAPSVKTKLSALWADSRSYKKRLLLAGAPILAFCYTFLFFGPLEMVAFSADSLSYTYQDVALILALLALAVFAVATPLITLLRGKIFNYVVSTLLGLTVAGYLQAAVMNGGLGTLTGDGIDWPARAGIMAVGLLAWLTVILAVFFVMYLHREVWKKVVCYVSALLIVMQLAPTIGIFAGAYSDTLVSEGNKYSLSEEEMCEFSKNDNIFVFVLDRLDYDYIEKAMAENPNFLAGFDGFTSYTNAVSAFARTRPALAHLLTGCEELAYKVPVNDYYSQAWSEDGKNLLADLKGEGYDIGLYTKINYLFSDPKFAEKYVDNVYDGKGEIKVDKVLEKLMNLSAYRYLPTAMKPFFWADTNYYNTDVFKTSTTYQFDDAHYAQQLVNGTADKTSNSFKFYHFFGPHAPYTLNPDGTASDTETNVTAQTLGSFANLTKIFQRMKDLGIYNDATIIITADHGRSISDMKPIQEETLIGLFYKPSGSFGKPLVTSHAPVSTDNIPATILKAAGADYSKYGRALDEIGEDEVLVRTAYKSIIHAEKYHEIELYTYEITGDATNFDNWKIVKHEEISSGNGFY